MLRCFRTAVVEYGFLSRVRCDYGGENVDMARLMITTRGTGGGSVITSSFTLGSEPHTWNQLSGLHYTREKSGLGAIASTDIMTHVQQP